ncbi:MAG: PLP-dependent aminotransferase family protein [Eubacteriales bacterium]|nr:PLP-dependent aminotransferase family protein [Eubacteriales bacterium]
MENILLELDRSSSVPLYEQVYEAFSARIRRGEIAAGTRLPSKRTLCADLGVSRSVVENALDMLRAEGYISTLPRSGCYVMRCEILPSAPPVEAPPEREPEPAAVRFDYATGDVDTSRFPYTSWSRLFRETVCCGSDLLQRGDGRGDPELRAALADFLGEYRGVRCQARQIVVGAGIEYLLDLLIRLFDDKTVFACENPGYAGLYRSIPQRTRLIGLDERGIRVDELAASDATVALVTPSHQFPLGITMPVGRRTELLKWASVPGRCLIEDDYDSEFRYGPGVIRSLQGLDAGGDSVIYMGTFSRSIASSIRIAYMVLPPSLSERYDARFGRAASTVSRFEQQTLARFISCGMYARHLRRMTSVYRGKQEILINELKKNPSLLVSGQEAGLHFLVRTRRREDQLLARAWGKKLRLRFLGQYYLDRRPPDGPGVAVVGYAGLDPDRLPQAARALFEVLSG